MAQVSKGRLVIVLQEDLLSTSTSRVYHSGDLLRGQIRINVNNNTDIGRVAVLFKGTTRTWVDDDGQTTALQHEFLKQSHNMSIHEGTLSHTKQGLQYALPFQFRIAAHCFPNEGLSPAMSQLPPTLQEGEASIDRHGRPCMQPLIVYGISAIVTVRHQRSEQLDRLQAFRHVRFMPWTEPGPPVIMDHFPGEFRASCSSSLRTRRFAMSAIGKLTVSMDEPQPLPSLPDGTMAKSEGQLYLRFSGLGHRTASDPAPCLTCDVKTCLLRKIYYSTMPVKETASNQLMKSNKYLRCRKEVLLTRYSSIDTIRWMADTTMYGGWMSRYPIDLSVSPDLHNLHLLPSFCSPLATLRYSLSVSLRVLGFSHSELSLEVPLQVYHRRPYSTADNGRPIALRDPGSEDVSEDERIDERDVSAKFSSPAIEKV